MTTESEGKVMRDNLILSDAIEQFVVEDRTTGERIAVITHEDVFTASDNIVVRLKPSTSNDPPYNVKSETTAALVKELAHGEGVKAIEAAPYEDINVACTGPTIVLVVED